MESGQHSLFARFVGVACALGMTECGDDEVRDAAPFKLPCVIDGVRRMEVVGNSLALTTTTSVTFDWREKLMASGP